mmetsp:Transcript_20848/g.47315  ORF Transcript_20848/g.47315 Transcript_20848/m.47315 type:complete len:493 (+) Transcript_20848:1308-2786(+)
MSSLDSNNHRTVGNFTLTPSQQLRKQRRLSRAATYSPLQPTFSAIHAPGSTFAAAALISGTTIGAGVLALPAVAAPAGFLPSSGALILAWAYMAVGGVLLAELSINALGETGRTGLGILELQRRYLGKAGGIAGGFAYFFLHYAVIVAYLSQGGSNLACAIRDVSGLDLDALGRGLPQIFFSASVGSAIYFGSKRAVEALNNVMVGGVILSFLGLVAIGLSTADLGALINPEFQHPENVVNALPIIFVSLVFGNIVPTVVTQLEGDRKKITTAIVGGSAVPLVMLLAWNAVIIGNLAHVPEFYEVLSTGTAFTDAGKQIDPIGLLQSEGHGGVLLKDLVATFSEFAIVTSLIGLVYGMRDAFTDVLKISTEGKEFNKWKPAIFAGVLIPPLVVASAGYEHIFIDALDLGGAFGVSTLFLVLPPLMVWKSRYEDPDRSLTTLPMVPGGKLTLGALWKAAGTLIIEQGADKLGIIDWVKEEIMPQIEGVIHQLS